MSNSFKSCSSTSPGIHNSCFAWRIQTVIAILLLFGNASISGEEDPPTAKRDIEVGIRVGPGYKAKQQFDSNLQNYTTNGTTSDLSSIDVSKFNSLTNFEFLFRRRWSSDLKFGFVIGQNNYEDISYTEIRPDRYLTQLNFSINTTYFLITYHTEWNFRNFFIEGGLGIGLGQTTWITHGFTKSPYDYVDQLGTMNGYGLQYKADAAFSRWVSDSIILQLGAAMNYTSVPSFSGSLNGDSIPFYYKNDGTVSALGQTNDPGSNAIVLAALASKSPNFYVASLVVYFSAICRFSI